MALEELKSLLEQAYKEDLVCEDTLYDVLSQAEAFEKRRSQIELDYKGHVVVMCGGELFAALTLDEALKLAHQRFPDRPCYAGVIGWIARGRSAEWI